MSLVTVKNAIAILLSDNLGPTKIPTAGPITLVDTTYPRTAPNSLQINAIIWSAESTEKRVAGDAGGLKEKDYRILTHLTYFGVDESVMSNDDWDELIVSVEALYRANVGLVLGGVDSEVLRFGENMDVITPQPGSIEGGLRRTYLELQAVIVNHVTEVIRS